MQFAKLKLVSAVRRRKSVVDIRRDKLLGKLDDQIGLATAMVAGTDFQAKRSRVVVDADGRRERAMVPARVKQWWWTATNGKVMLALRYGSKPIELAKGKNAIEVGSIDGLIGALEAVKDAVHAGELDAQIEQASGALREGFAKKK